MSWLQPTLGVVDPQQILHAHLAQINQLGIDIVIVREVTQAEGTHRAPWRQEPPGGIPARVCIRYTGGGDSNVSDLLTGHQSRDVAWSMLLPAEVPLRSGDGEDGRSRLEFTHPTHGRLRIRRVRPWDLAGRVVGWQADLERIAGATPLPEAIPSMLGGRRRLESDDNHPWRDLVRKAEALKAQGPRLSWRQIAARLDVTEERLAEYRKRAHAA